MKTIKTMGMLFLILAAFSATLKADSDYYYYYLDNQHVSAEFNDTLVAVRQDTMNILEAGWLAQTYDFLTLGYDYMPIGGRFHTYKIEPGYDLETVVNTLRQNEEVFMVNPIIMKRDTIPLYLNNRIVAFFEEGMSYEDVEYLVSSYGLTIVEVIGTEEPIFYAMEYRGSTDQNIIEIANALSENSLCQLAHPDFLSKHNNLLAEPIDPYFIEQWHLHNIGQNGGTPDADIDYLEAFEWNPDTNWQIIISILDAGFEMDHEDLPENYLRWPIDVAGDDLYDDDPYGDSDPSPWCTGPQSLCWHGTMELGLIAPIVNNDVGLCGLLSNIKVQPVKFYDNHNQYSPTTILNGLKKTGYPFGCANIVCCPFHCVDSAGTIAWQMRAMYKGGTAVFCASGDNEWYVEFPANLPWVCAVGQTDRYDNVPMTSGKGPELDLVAPGFGVWSFDLSGEAGINHSTSTCNGDMDYYCHYEGTSVAVAIVAGVAAKLLATRPDLIYKGDSAQPLFDILYNTANDIGGKGRDDTYGHGRVNALRALIAVRAGDANHDGHVDVSDAVRIINYVFICGPAPFPYFALGDANGDCDVNLSDAVKIINYVFLNQPPPKYCPGLMPE